MNATSVCCLAALAGSLLGGEARAAETGETDHKIAPLDMISVDVVGEEDLTKELRVSSTGTITFPFLGTLEVKGLTPTELEMMVKEKLDKDYLVDPQVIVTVKEYRTRNVSVLGQVNKPGLIPLPAEQKLDILGAIAAAGGLTPAAKKKSIEVTRAGKTLKFAFKDLQEVSDPERKFWLEHDDVIYVHERFF